MVVVDGALVSISDADADAEADLMTYGIRWID